MEPDMAARQAWIIRVLGFDPPRGNQSQSSTGSKAKPDLLAIWREAKDAVDVRLGALRRALLDEDDPDFARLADSGLFALGTRQNVTLMASLTAFRGAPPDALAEPAARVREAVRAYGELLATSPIPQVVDENPFGVDVKLRATLGDALARIVAATR
ncbi:MAG TPA: hypothetical protein VFN42_12805 [Acetobacteraceae bacterium]|nr:hypothetical protein [Acetobacteraceae bacterium]